MQLHHSVTNLINCQSSNIEMHYYRFYFRIEIERKKMLKLIFRPMCYSFSQVTAKMQRAFYDFAILHDCLKNFSPANSTLQLEVKFSAKS